MKIPIGNLVGQVRGNQAETRQCYAMSTRVAEKHKVVNTIFHLEDVETPPALTNIFHAFKELDPQEKEMERSSSPVEEMESIKLDDQHPERTVHIGSQLPRSLQDQLVDLLKEHKEVFAWSHEDMPGIDPSIIVHRLNVDSTYKPVI